MNIILAEKENVKLDIEPAKIQKIQKESSDILDQAKLLSIFDAESFANAAGFLRQVRSILNEIDSTFDPIISAQHQAHKESLKAKRKHSEPLYEAEEIVKSKIRDYHIEQERTREKEEARLQHEARKAEEARILQMAIEAEESGNLDQADSILSKPIQTPLVSLESNTYVPGISYREVWRFRIIDPALVPEKYKVIDEKKIGAVVRALKDKTTIPGVEVYSKKIVATRSV